MATMPKYFALLLLLSLVGCGGGGGTQTAGDTSGPPLTSAQLNAIQIVVDESSTKYSTLVKSVGVVDAANQVVTWAKAQPHVTSAVSENGGNVVRILYDSGVVSVCYSSSRISAASGAYKIKPSATPKDLSLFPNGPTAAIYNSFFSQGMASSGNEFYNALHAAHYNIAIKGSGSPVAMDVPSLADLKKYAVTIIISDGFVSTNDGGECIITAEKYNKASVPVEENKLLKAGKLIIGSPLGDPNSYYCFTPSYVAGLTRTSAANPFVYADCCDSMDDVRLATAFDLGTAYLGWHSTVNDLQAAVADQALIDLLSGSRNLVNTAGIPLGSLPSGQDPSAPLNIGHALNVMDAINYGTPAQCGAQILLASGGNWGLIPHLDDINFGFEGSLEGSFENNAGLVFINDKSYAISSPYWNTSAISLLPVRLATAGTRILTGKIYVQANGLNSNVIQFFATDSETHNSTDGTKAVHFAVQDPNHQLTQVVVTGPGAGSGFSPTYIDSEKLWEGEIPVTSNLTSQSTTLNYSVNYGIVSGAVPTPKSKFSVTGYSTGFLNSLRPQGTIKTSPPSPLLFSWSPAAKPNTEYVLDLYAPYGTGPHGGIWESDSTNVNALYTGTLQPNVQYTWLLQAFDPDTGNATENWGNFEYSP